MAGMAQAPDTLESTLLELYQNAIHNIEHLAFRVWDSQQIHIIQIRNLRRELDTYLQLLIDLSENVTRFTIKQQSAILNFRIRFNAVLEGITRRVDRFPDEEILSDHNIAISRDIAQNVMHVLREANICSITCKFE